MAPHRPTSSQINGRPPNLASDPEMAEIALRNIERRAKQGDPPGNQGRIWFGSGLSRSKQDCLAKRYAGSPPRAGDGGEVWLGVAGKDGAQGSSKSPQKLAPTTFDALCASTCLYVSTANSPLTELLGGLTVLLELPLELGAASQYTLAAPGPAAVAVARRSFSGTA